MGSLTGFPGVAKIIREVYPNTVSSDLVNLNTSFKINLNPEDILYFNRFDISFDYGEYIKPYNKPKFIQEEMEI